MRLTIFEYKSYKCYLNEWIRSNPGKGRGIKSALAKAAQCQTTYVSQVLNGDRHFSAEQAEQINLFIGHTPDEAQYFHLLVSHARAGSAALRKRLEGEMHGLVEKHQNLKNRLASQKEELSPEHQHRYYQTWYITAIHVCLNVAGLRTPEQIARALALPLETVKESLEFLLSSGLAAREGGEYRTTQNVVFVGRDSPNLLRHHVNWRHQAIRSIELQRKPDLHYSGVVAVNAEDAPKLHAIFTRAIEEARALWKASEKEDSIHAISVDFFKLSA